MALTVLAEDAVWKAEFSCSVLGVPAAVAGIDFILAGGLGRLMGQVWSLSSFEVSRQLLTDDLN